MEVSRASAWWVLIAGVVGLLSSVVLLLDKILGIAEAYGFETLSSDASARETFARHIAQALGKPHITVDLPGLRIGY